jgi:hypothetical protein
MGLNLPYLSLPSWDQVEATSRVYFSFSGAFKTFASLWDGKNLVIPNQ